MASLGSRRHASCLHQFGVEDGLVDGRGGSHLGGESCSNFCLSILMISQGLIVSLGTFFTGLGAWGGLV